MKKSKGKWIRIGLIAAAIIGLFIFLFSRGGSGARAKYTDGINRVKLGDTEYELVNDILKEEYIGSDVRAGISTERGEVAGTIKSFFILTMATLYRVKGDAEGRYLVDSSGRIYAKAGEAAALKAGFEDGSAFTSWRIDDATKTLEGMKELPKEQVEAVLSLIGSDAARKSIDETLYVSDFNNRREVFAFTADGLFRKPVAELFYYGSGDVKEVFLTTAYKADKKSTTPPHLEGIRLPEEWQAAFSGYWK
ncbi:MAG: hypothetical protein J5645_02075 [Lachnospiraceae bacterium]|nr:hypothetical protein [Lachnospiraceae bacterium]